MKIQQTEGSFSIIDLSEDELWQIVSCLKFNDDLGKGIAGYRPYRDHCAALLQA